MDDKTGVTNIEEKLKTNNFGYYNIRNHINNGNGNGYINGTSNGYGYKVINDNNSTRAG